MTPTEPSGDAARSRPVAGLHPALICVLAANLGLGVWALTSQLGLKHRIDALEKGSAREAVDHPRSGGGEVPTLAGRRERIAILLAAANDSDSTRRLLDSFSAGERLEIARALLTAPPENDRNAALGALFRRLAVDEPRRALELLAVLPESDLRQTFAAQIAGAWIESDPAAAAAWMATGGQQYLASAGLNRLLTSAITRWSSFDPAAATEFVATSVPITESSAQALRATAREWARKDPAAAMAWTRRLPAGDPRKAPATFGALEGWTEVDPSQAAGYVGQLTYGSSASYAGEAAAVAAQWTRRDPSAAAQWAATLPDRSSRHDALRQAAASWAATDPASAARWAATLPANADRGELWQGICGDWAGIDPTGAENWLSTLPAGGDRDAAVAAFAAKIVPADPAKALTWARTLSSSRFAAEQIRDLLAVWSRKDALAARNWAAANAVSFSPP